MEHVCIFNMSVAVIEVAKVRRRNSIIISMAKKKT